MAGLIILIVLGAIYIWLTRPIDIVVYDIVDEDDD